MLRNRCLGIVEMIDNVFIANGNHAAVCLHYVSEHIDSGRVCQSIGNSRDKENFFFKHSVGFFS